jgi:hypothetical protein
MVGAGRSVRWRVAAGALGAASLLAVGGCNTGAQPEDLITREDVAGEADAGGDVLAEDDADVTEPEVAEGDSPGDVETAAVLAEPLNYLDDEVTLEAFVEEVLAEGAFTLTTDAAGVLEGGEGQLDEEDPQLADDDFVIIASPDDTDSLQPGTRVVVEGIVRNGLANSDLPDDHPESWPDDALSAFVIDGWLEAETVLPVG